MKFFKSGYSELNKTPNLTEFSATSQCCASGTADCEDDDIENSNAKKEIRKKKIVAYNVIHARYKQRA